MKIAIGCDPNAQAAKEEVIAYIAKKGMRSNCFGSEDPIYANVAIAVGEAVAAKKYDRGILICGTGIGVSIAANKVPVLMQRWYPMYIQLRGQDSATMQISCAWVHSPQETKRENCS